MTATTLRTRHGRRLLTCAALLLAMGAGLAFFDGGWPTVILTLIIIIAVLAPAYYYERHARFRARAGFVDD